MSTPHTPEQLDSQCAATAFNGWCTNPCSKKAKVERDGARYCTIHDPVRVNAIREKKDAEWRRKWDAKRAVEARSKACVSACEGLADPSVVPELLEALTDLCDAIPDQTLSDDPPLTVWVNVARAIIKKAEVGR